MLAACRRYVEKRTDNIRQGYVSIGRSKQEQSPEEFKLGDGKDSIYVSEE